MVCPLRHHTLHASDWERDELLALLCSGSALLQLPGEAMGTSARLIWGLLLLSCGLVASAEQTWPVQGKLIWSDGVRAADLRLLLRLDGGKLEHAWPRANGLFSFPHVPSGSHLLDVVSMDLVYPQVGSSAALLAQLSSRAELNRTCASSCAWTCWEARTRRRRWP